MKTRNGLFNLETDHKPLIPIINNKLICDLSPRIQLLRMKLLKCNFTAHYVPGKDLDDADAFSRAPTEEPTEDDQEMEKELYLYVNAIMGNLPASDPMLEKIRSETVKDKVLTKVAEYTREGWPERKN